MSIETRTIRYVPGVQDSATPNQAATTLPDGSVVIIRTVVPEDERLMAAFQRRLSDQNVEQRYFRQMKLEQRISPERLARVCSPSNNDAVIVADRQSAVTMQHDIIGVGELAAASDTTEGEIALVVADRWRHSHVGGMLLQGLLHTARRNGLKRVRATILTENIHMLRLCEQFGFTMADIARNPINAIKCLTCPAGAGSDLSIQPQRF